jgi:hypothetical protein
MKGGGETGKENYFVIRWLLEDGSQHARLLDVCEYGRLHRLLFGEPRLEERLMIAEVDRFLNHVRDHNLKFLEGSLESVKVLEYRITRRNCVARNGLLVKEELSVFRKLDELGGDPINPETGMAQDGEYKKRSCWFRKEKL